MDKSRDKMRKKVKIAFIVAALFALFMFYTAYFDPGILGFLSPLVGVVLVVGMLVFFMGGDVAEVIKNKKNKKRLMKVGVKAKAKILKIGSMDTFIEGAYRDRVTVEVKNGIQATFLMEDVMELEHGGYVDILYDPADPTIAVAAE